MPFYNAHIEIKTDSGEFEKVTDSANLREAGGALFAVSAADSVVAQLKALPSAGPAVLRELIADQKARIETLFDLALRDRKDQHWALAAHFEPAAVEVTTSQATRDASGRIASTLTKKYSTAP